MALNKSTSREGPSAKRRKLNTPAPLPKPKTKTKQHRTTSKPANRTSTISPRRRWRSDAPRAQHSWQKVARANAESEQGTELERVNALLGLVVRRNRNQHRSQSWWRELISLRKGVGGLVRLGLGLGLGLEGGGKGKAGLRVMGEESSVAVRERLAREAKQSVQKSELDVLVRETLLPRCYISFSRIVRDPQFATLGVVLMGLLARVGGEVGLPEVQVEVVRGESLRVTGMDGERGEVVSREWWAERREGDGDEKGEKIERSEIVQEETVNGTTEAEEVKQKIERRMSSMREEKKKPSKKSTIDDLFAGLV
jgi:ribonuclease MRP protein subunit RMP1